MKLGRREFVVASGTAAAYALLPSQLVSGETKMHGLIGKAVAVDGKRDELIKILLEGVSDMPGCLSYVVAKDPARQERDLDNRGLGQQGKPQSVASIARRQGSHRERQAVVREL